MLHPVLRRSLRQAGLRVWRSVIVVGMISLGALAAWVVIVHLEARQLALRDAERNAAVVAHAIAREQERLIDTAKQLLVGLSQRQEVLTANAGPCNVLFAGVVKGFPGYLDLVAVKADGQVFCAARPSAALPGSTDPRDIARTIESGSPTLGRYGFDRGRGRPTITLAAPAVDGAGVVRAVIIVALDLGQLVRAVLETPLPRGASMVLVDANGVILGRVPEGEGWSGELVDEPLRRLLAERPAGMHEGVGLDGAPTLFLVEPLLRETSRAWDAAVVITLPRQAVFRAADRLFMLQLAGLGVLALGGVIVIGMLVDRLFGGPAYGLLRVVRSLNAGDVRARMRRTDGTGVIGRLSRSVNALALRMEEHQHAAAALEDQLRNERAARLVETLPPPPPPTAAARPEGSRTPTPTYSVEPVLEDPVAETADGVPSEEEAYWGLRETAFENAPNPRFLWLSPAHSDALVRLSYALRQRRGCAVLTGEPGCGKTLLTRAVVQRLEPDRYEVGLLTNPHGGRVDLLREVLYELGVETGESDRAELQHQLHDLIARNFQAGRETVLIVDDAQQADNPEWFEELSTLLNIQTNERALVTILLAGTPDLIPKVHAVRHLDRRVSIRCQLEPLTQEQTAQYLRYRLSVAGCRDEIFTSDAVSAIHQATQGIPRQINDLGDSAMMWARLHQARPVDAEVVQRVLSAPVR
jgi:general secretion pathway protein A